jgi:hypothetical protein
MEISSKDPIIKALTANGLQLKIEDEELKIEPTFIRVDHLTIDRKDIGMYIHDPSTHGTDEDNILWTGEIKAFATIGDEQVPIVFTNPENMITINHNKVYPDES